MSQFVEMIKPSSFNEMVHGPDSTVAGYRSIETEERTSVVDDDEERRYSGRSLASRTPRFCDSG
jgi:hypothetical protein